MNCELCNRTLTADEIGLNYKLISRQAEEFLCKTCMARYFSVEEKKLDEKIAQFKHLGCHLFTPESDAEDGPGSV